MSKTYRVVGWHAHEDGSSSIRSIHEFHPTKTLSGTHRKLGRSILHNLRAESVDYVKVSEHTNGDHCENYQNRRRL